MVSFQSFGGMTSINQLLLPLQRRSLSWTPLPAMCCSLPPTQPVQQWPQVQADQ